jgi:transposase
VAIYASTGRPSIPPEKLLRTLLQTLFSVRSERQLMQQITYNILFRWFVELAMDAPVWDITVFTKNRDRLLAATSRAASWRRSWPTRRSGRCSRRSISRSMAH